ncbi:MAG: hypothetical protein PHI16_06715, partial [Methanocellales archaeon]|nr:hypothetical protein [Methanocellales archaeon]
MKKGESGHKSTKMDGRMKKPITFSFTPVLLLTLVYMVASMVSPTLTFSSPPTHAPDNSSSISRTLSVENTIPGQNHTTTIKSTDPGFGEVNATNATHLYENYGFISNIFDEVKEQDYNRSESIYENEFVRGADDQTLINGSVIDVYAGNVNPTNNVGVPNPTNPLVGAYDAPANPRTGIVVYSDSTTAALFWRAFNATTGFGSENSITTTGFNEFWIDTEASPTNGSRIIFGANDQDSKTILTFLYDAKAGTVTQLTTVTANTPVTYTALFDIEFEQKTGDALIVYINGATDVKYRTLLANQTNWGPEQTWGTGVNWDNGYWIRAARDPSSDDIMVGMESTIADGATLVTALWNGSGVGPTIVHGVTSLKTAIKLTQDFGIAWEGDRGEAILVWADNSATINLIYNTYKSGAWGTAASLGTAGLNGKQASVQLATEYAGVHDKVGVVYVGGNEQFVKCNI